MLAVTSVIVEKCVSICFLTFYHSTGGAPPNVGGLGVTSPYSPFRRAWVPLPYLTLPPGWAGSYTCPALRPYQLGPMRIPECKGYR